MARPVVISAIAKAIIEDEPIAPLISSYTSSIEAPESADESGRNSPRIGLIVPRLRAIVEQASRVGPPDRLLCVALVKPHASATVMNIVRRLRQSCQRYLTASIDARIYLYAVSKKNRFQPPSIANSLRDGDQLLQLSADICSVLRLIDAVLEISPQARPHQVAQAGPKTALTGE